MKATLRRPRKAAFADGRSAGTVTHTRFPAASQHENSGAIRVGSDEHKGLFCRMLHQTFDPYEPSAIVWPKLDEAEQKLLCGLPIWDIAVRTEDKASVNVLTYARMVEDPELREAIELNGFEEARHRQLLSGMVSAYGIELEPEPPYPAPRSAEWAFMVTGYSECIDSFFAFGLFEASRRSGLFPAALADAFEPVMQEECRHILFFVNWVARHRRNLPLWQRPVFAAKVLGVWLFLLWERVRTARDMGGGNNFTMTGAESAGIGLDATDLLDLCLAENERRMAHYDLRLLRPNTVPRLARLVRRMTGKRRPIGGSTGGG